MGCLDSFGASVSLKMPSFEIDCFYLHNTFLSFWKVRPMVWESSVPAALWGQASSVAQTVSMVQSGAKVVVYQATCPYPCTRSRSGMANVFIKSSLLEQGFFMHLGQNGQSCPIQSVALDDVSMAGAEEE